MKFSKKWLVIAGAVIAIGLFAAFGLNRKPATQYFVQAVQHGDISEVVESTGTINAVVTVQVGSQVSGSIAKLNADLKRMSRKKDSPRPSERCGRGNLHPAPPLLTSFLEG